MTDKWLERKEEELFNNESGIQVNPEKLLEIGPVNKTIFDENQAKLGIVTRLAHAHFTGLYPSDKGGTNRYDYMKLYPEFTENYDQVMDGETNARVQFIKLATGVLERMASAVKREARNLAQ